MKTNPVAQPHAGSLFSRDNRFTITTLLAAAPACLLLASLAFLIWRFRDGMTFVSFEDEAVHLLGARLLNRGGILYRTFVDSHGPVIFLFTQTYGALFGWAAPNGARAIPMLSALAAGAAIAASPALPTLRARLWATSLFAGCLGSVWLLQGLFMLSYYPVAGALAGIALAAFAAGAWGGAKLPASLAFAAGGALALLVGTAYSYGPSALLIAASGGIAALRHRQLRALYALLLGGLVGALVVLAYLLLFGDLRGYLAYHIAESQVAYAKYIYFSFGVFRASLIPSLQPDDIVQSLAVLCTAFAAAVLILLDVTQGPGRRRHVGEIMLGLVAILLLNARGMTIFQDGSFVVGSIVLAAIAAARLLDRITWQPDLVGSLCAAGLIVAFHAPTKQAAYTPFGFDHETMARWPRTPLATRSDAPVFARVRALTRPDEPILALTYQPSFYLRADRMPVDGYYTWFPWDALYARAPWFGVTRDLCTLLAHAPPKVIVYDGSPVWQYSPINYIPCLLDALQTRYVRDRTIDTGGEQIYVRQDAAAAGHV